MKRFIEDVSLVMLSTALVTLLILPGTAKAAFPEEKPTRVKQIGVPFSSEDLGPSRWGHSNHYDLAVINNRTPARNFLNCYVSERFTNVKRTTITAAFDSLPKDPSTNVSCPNGTFTDVNQTYVNTNTGRDTWWYSFDQLWDVSRSGRSWSAVDTHHIEHYQKEATRSGAE